MKKRKEKIIKNITDKTIHYDIPYPYIGDAPNPGDMQKIRENLEYILKVQKDYFEKERKKL
ncbi:MAG TPA: hypothetical protein VMZ91_08785 [Candidatus Paceibacterota bacterium]|nr:hypothetical protein [Candidatus Paceibacterota bacterium]